MIDVSNKTPKTIKEIVNNLDELIFWYSKEKINIILEKEEENNEKCC